MKIVVLCEGYTERGVLSDFLSRWLNPKVTQRVGIKTVRFNGWKQLVDDAPKKADLHLRESDVLGVVALLDLYGPTFYPAHLQDAEERRHWGMRHLKKAFQNEKYRIHFAVHELEAWILSQPELLPHAVARKLFPRQTQQPESVNSGLPPAKLLEKLYNEALKTGYKKVVHGINLFAKLDPNEVYRKCPAFAELADDLLSLCPAGIRK